MLSPLRQCTLAALLLALFVLLPLMAVAHSDKSVDAQAEPPRIDLKRYRITAAPPAPSARGGRQPGKAKNVQYTYGDPEDEGDEDDADVEECQVAPGDTLGRWEGVDLTEADSQAHSSTTLSLTGAGMGAGGAALYFGVEAGTPGYLTAPGYGNAWDQQALWTMPAPNPALPTDVELAFFFHVDVEPERDFFLIEANFDGTWVTIDSYTGTNRESNGMFEVALVFNQNINFEPGDYVGPGSNEIQLRLRVISDDHGSDQDGLWPSLGAAAVDAIRVRFNGVLVSFADFEPAGSNGGWLPRAENFVGNFVKAGFLPSEPDPCRTNFSCMLHFVDDGTPPVNPAYAGLGTGGAVGSWTYGPGGFVVNYTGGVSGTGRGIHNLALSEVFAAKEPGGDPSFNGAQLEFDVFSHLPLENGLFYLWHLRSWDDGVQAWTPWRDHGFVYYSPDAPHYQRRLIDVSTLVPDVADSIQVALGVVDLSAELGLPGNDATPSPFFDNVSFGRFKLEGPALFANDADLFQDSFPNQGSANYFGSPAEASVRLDAARDANFAGATILPADSVVMTARPVTAGAALVGPPRLRWVLNPNLNMPPGWRNAPAGSGTTIVLQGSCENPAGVATIWGSVDGAVVTTPSGDPIVDRWWFDLPDGPAHPNAPDAGDDPTFFLAGDELHYFFEATNSLGQTTTLPADTTGFGDFRGCSAYDPRFRVRALPSAQPGGGQPRLLVLNDNGHGAHEGAYLTALAQNGWSQGEVFDYYTVKEPSGGHSNGIGSAFSHGANLDQLAGYECVLYLAGDQSRYLLSDGSGMVGHDKGNDVQLLRDWRALQGPRGMVYFGSDLASGLDRSGVATASYLADVMAVDFVEDDVRDDIDGQLTPVLAPTHQGGSGGVFTGELPAGGCTGVEQFDYIEALPSAVPSHEFLDRSGNASVFTAAASVWHGRVAPGLGPRLDVTFPVAFFALLNPVLKAPPESGARAVLLGEVMAALGHFPEDSQATNTPAVPQLRHLANHPNPFNPATTISFELTHGARVRAGVFDARGNRVRQLLDRELSAGIHQLPWNATDAAGKRVASGIYMVEVETQGQRYTHKIALLK